MQEELRACGRSEAEDIASFGVVGGDGDVRAAQGHLLLHRQRTQWGRGGVRLLWGRGGVRLLWGRGGLRLLWGRGGVRLLWGRGGVKLLWGKGGVHIYEESLLQANLKKFNALSALFIHQGQQK